MINAKPPAGGADSSAELAATSWLGTRSRRVIAIVIAVAIALGITIAVFAQLAPTASLVTSPTSSPPASAPGSESPSAGTPTASPTGSAAVPDVAPIAIDEPGTIRPGLTAQITRVEAVDGMARGPGETAGPSLRVTVTINNSSSAKAPLNTAVISCYFGGDLTPAQELRDPGGSRLPTSIAAGKTVTGVYIFTVPDDERDNVTLMVDYAVDVSPLVFRGDVATLMTR